MNKAIQDGNNKIHEEELDISRLPRATGLTDTIIQYQGCWFLSTFISNILAFQQQFQAKDQDIILASNPKSGTTWLKALLFSILNRSRFTPSNTPLLTSNPHHLVPFLEVDIFSENPTHHDLPSMSLPRLFATHIPYSSFPESVVNHPKCRIVYICRNPLDYITSLWHFVKGFSSGGDANSTIEECIDMFCAGKHESGPFWDHVLGFWRVSQENPDKVLFLTYEDMLENTISHVERIAEFVGFPFSDEEKSQEVVEQIVELCSFANLKELDVNKHGKLANFPIEYKIYFRKAKVGDWVNHLSPSMVERVEKVIHEKLYGSGLTFKYKI